MSVASNAVQNALNIANDNSHGYDQANRWGPDYDCSSLVITAFKKAGVPLTCTYTGNMLSDMLAHGFKNVTSSINLVTGAGLQPGDVLLNVAHHTAMYIGNGILVQASSNENGGIVGGKTGDQTGAEIATRSYFNFPWNYILRYSEGSSTPAQTTTPTSTQKPSGEIQNGIYTVKLGDTLWALAVRFYGDGTKYAKIMKDNGLTTSMIHAGQQLKIGDQPAVDTQVSVSDKCNVSLPILKYGDNGLRVRKIQNLLKLCGYSIDTDGDFGSETKAKIEMFQQTKGIPVTGKVDAKTYEALLS